MLHRSLRMLKVNIILKMAFNLCRLARHIEQIHEEQSSENQVPFTVYYGQGLSKVHFDNLFKIGEGLVAFKKFLSTSKKRNISMNFARCALVNLNLVDVLNNTMTIDPVMSSAPFALMDKVSYYEDTEQKILFFTKIVFRNREIEQIDSNNRQSPVKLTLTAVNDS
ncbi:unnamed protein product [Rotaria sp. Silwood1]|nr:unnamed protein product [Rotaria sp. Silwood1]